jgi:hypothetical protein
MSSRRFCHFPNARSLPLRRRSRSPSSLIVAIGLLLSVLLLAACSENSEPTAGCAGGHTEPLTVEDVTSSLARHGVVVESDESSALCSAAGLVADLVNSDSDARETGLTGCAVRKRPIYANPMKLREEASEEKVRFFLANVECYVYPNGEPGEERVGQVRAALLELERRL